MYKNDLHLFTTRVRNQIAFLLLLLCSTLLLTSCGESNDKKLSGIVTIWHSWGEQEAAVLNQILNSFMDIHPNVTIRTTSIESEQLFARFQQSASTGLGPDLLLGPSHWIMPLADAGLIQEIDPHLPSDLWKRFLPASVETVRYQDRFYGVPESLRILGLYHNKRIIETPPQTLDALIDEMKQGKRAGMSPAFVDAFWGIQAFGGELFDADERVVLDNGGLANWLVWLKAALDIPNIVFDKDPQTLTQLFSDGELDYLVAGSWLRKELQNALGENLLGVAPLPAGPIQAAGPFLKTDVFMFSMASSRRQLRLAATLTTFITNAEQQTVLMRRAGRIPTNVRVRNNPSVDPMAHAFRLQARSAVPFRNTHNMDAVIQLGNDAYNRALQGVAEPIAIANELTDAINLANGFTIEFEKVAKCVGHGALTIWYAEDLSAGDALLSIGKNLVRECPAIEVEFNALPIIEIAEQLKANGPIDRPDLMLIPNQWVVPLASDGLLQPLNGFTETQHLQIYHPNGVKSMRFNEQLYGIPFVLMPQALYVNMSLVSETAGDLNDLVVQGQMGEKTAFPLSFADAYWGVSAHGGKLFDEEGKVILDQGGMTEWLNWLANAQTNAEMILDTQIETLRIHFAAGEIAYLVDRPRALAEFEKVLGNNLHVTRLPSGPVADAAPLLLAAGFALKNDLATVQTQLALEFVTYATNLENQTLLVDIERLLPANIGVTIDPVDPLTVFSEQAGTSVVYPSRLQMSMVEQLGAKFYMHLLNDDYKSDSDTEQTVLDIVAEINQANGFEPIANSDSVQSDINTQK